MQELESGQVIHKLLCVYSKKLGVSLVEGNGATVPSLAPSAQQTPQTKLYVTCQHSSLSCITNGTAIQAGACN